MEDLTSRPGNRGQLVVVTALALAVLLSLLALTMNTAVLGEVHIAQSPDSLRAERSAVQFEYAARRGIRGVLPPVNERFIEYTGLRSGLDAAVTDWTGLAESEYARDDISANASLTAVTFRTEIIQNQSRNFTDRNGSTSWTIAENVSSVSGYEMNVSDVGLTETDDCAVNSSCTELIVDDSNGEWRMAIHSTPNTTIAVTVDNGTGTQTCSTSRSSVLLNITNGTFTAGNSTCEFTTFGETNELDPPYTLTYRNANNVSGTYELTVPGRVVNETIAADDRYGTSGAPRLSPRIVNADVVVQFRSADLIYRTAIQVNSEGNDG